MRLASGSRILPALAAALLLCWPGPVQAAYEVVTRAAEVLQADTVQFAGPDCYVSRGESTQRLAATEIDYYETFRRNAQSGAGNVVVFRTGSLFRFESIGLKGPLLALKLGDEGQVTVPEGLVDFERSVREGAAVWLPKGKVHVDVARLRTGGDDALAAARSAEEDGLDPVDRARLRGSSLADRRSQARTAGTRDLSRRAAVQRAGSPSAPASQVFRPGSLDQDSGGSNQDESAGDGSSDQEPAEGPRRRDGIAEVEDVRRRAEEQGQENGLSTVLVSSPDSRQVHGVQFRVRYPANCTPTGGGPAGAFANGALAQSNGQVLGRNEYEMAIALQAGAPSAAMPGEIARLNFVWTGQEPTPADFALMSVIATDELGNTLPGFQAVAVMIQ